MDYNRWKRAQSSEREHESHQSYPDDTSWAEDHFSDVFDLPLEKLHGKRILEVGSGTGMIHSFTFPCENVGIDPLSSELNLQGSPASVITGVGERLPFRDGSFDVLICYNVLDHVVNPDAVTEEMYRVLRNQGWMFLTVNVFFAPAFMCRIADHVDRPHPHHFTPDEVRTFVDEAGFEIMTDMVQPHSVSAHNSLKAWAGKQIFGLHQQHVEGIK